MKLFIDGEYLLLRSFSLRKLKVKLMSDLNNARQIFYNLKHYSLIQYILCQILCISFFNEIFEILTKDNFNNYFVIYYASFLFLDLEN